MLSIIIGMAVIFAGGTPGPSHADVALALRAGEMLEEQRCFDAARRQYLAVAEVDSSLNDELFLRICNLWWLEGDTARARACYEQHMQQAVSPEIKGAAAYRRATLLLSNDNEWFAAQEVLLSILNQWPQTVAAVRAFTALAQEWQQRQQTLAASEMIHDWGARLVAIAADSSVPEDGVATSHLAVRAYLLAGERFLAEQLQSRAEAAYLAALEVAVNSQIPGADAALLGLARVFVQQGLADDALQFYERIIENHDKPWLIGSHTSAALDAAFLEQARLLEKLGRRRAAVAIYDRFIKVQSASRQVHMAAFRRARLLLEDGDDRPMRQFLQDFPASRHRAAAQSLLGEP